MVQAAGRQNRRCGEKPLEHAEHDGADEGECDIGGDNAQSADQSTIRHWQISGVTSLPAPTPLARKAFHAKKVSLAVPPSSPDLPGLGNVVKES